MAPRNGKNLSVWTLTRGLTSCYNLSTPLALFLALGGFILLRRIRNVNLYEIGEHGRVEHDASLVHRDTPKDEKYAPVEVDQNLVDLLIADARAGGEESGEGSESGEKRILMNATDVARARVRREKESPRLDSIHAEIARGEMAIILGVLEAREGKNVGVPVEWLREWIGHERLPKDWKPTHVEGFFDVVKRAKAILVAMKALRAGEAQAKL
ncbi:hypothetical protein H0H93_013732 [Arthromyces matolae]|nr:hypothetical protein H0H93_013732 [Arthromyces matolae]